MATSAGPPDPRAGGDLGPGALPTRDGYDAVTVLTAYVVLVFAIRPSFVVAPLGSVGQPPLILGVAGLVMWLCLQAGRLIPGDGGRRPVRIGLLLVALAFSASFVNAMSRPIDALEVSTAVSGLVLLAALSGVALLASDGISSWNRLHRLLGTVVIGGSLLALLGIAQFFTGRLLYAGWVPPGLTSNLSELSLESREGFARPAGTAIHPLEFAASLTAVLPLALTLARFAPRRSAWAWAMVVVIGLGLLVSLSRSATICAVVAILVLAAVWPPAFRWRMLAAGVLLGAAASAAAPRLIRSVLNLFLAIQTDSSVGSRVGSYSVAGEYFQRAPFVGRGFGTFLPAYRIFDNGYLLLLVETGIIGLGSVVLLLAAAMWSARQGRKLARTDFEREIGQALMAGVASGGTAIAFFDGFSFPMSTGILFLLVGTCSGYHQLMRRAATREPAEPISSTDAGRRGPGR